MAAKTTTVLQPITRIYRDWTPALIDLAAMQSDYGNLSYAADLVDTMFADEHVRGVLDTRTSALTSRPVTFEQGLGRRKKAAVKALEAEEDWFKCFPEQELKLFLAWGIMLGVALARIDWTLDEHTGRELPKLRVWNPRNLKFDTKTRKWMVAVVNADDERREIEVTPGEWVVFTPYGSERPWSHGAWRAIAKWMLLKEFGRDDWGFYSNRHGSAIMLATGVSDEEQQEKVTDELRETGHNAAFAVGEGMDVKLVEAQARTWETFAAQIDAANMAASIAILGNNLTSIVTGGSQAAATVHSGVSLVRTIADGEILSTALHDDVLTYWAERNFGGEHRNAAPWPVFDVTPKEDLKADASTLLQVMQAIATAQTSGAPLDVRAVLETFGLPTVAEPAPAPAPTPEQQAA